MEFVVASIVAFAFGLSFGYILGNAVKRLPTEEDSYSPKNS